MYVPGASSMVISNATHELINEFGEEILAGVLWHLSEGDEDFKPQ